MFEKLGKESKDKIKEAAGKFLGLSVTIAILAYFGDKVGKEFEERVNFKKAQLEKIEEPSLEEQEQFFSEIADDEFRQSIFPIVNVVSLDKKESFLQDYNDLIEKQVKDIEGGVHDEKPMTKGEYLAIHARAVDLAWKLGVTVGDVIEKDVNEGGAVKVSEYYLGTIDLGENITKKVVPETFTKIYVNFDEDGNVEKILGGGIEPIKIPGNHQLLTDSERTIRMSK